MSIKDIIKDHFGFDRLICGTISAKGHPTHNIIKLHKKNRSYCTLIYAYASLDIKLYAS